MHRFGPHRHQKREREGGRKKKNYFGCRHCPLTLSFGQASTIGHTFLIFVQDHESCCYIYLKVRYGSRDGLSFFLSYSCCGKSLEFPFTSWRHIMHDLFMRMAERLRFQKSRGIVTPRNSKKFHCRKHISSGSFGL